MTALLTIVGGARARLKSEASLTPTLNVNFRPSLRPTSVLCVAARDEHSVAARDGHNGARALWRAHLRLPGPHGRHCRFGQEEAGL